MILVKISADYAASNTGLRKCTLFESVSLHYRGKMYLHSALG